jgi:RNA polymerase sigma-70 factor (ECF subfamily)
MKITAMPSTAGFPVRDDETTRLPSLDLLQRFAAGDLEAFETLFRQFQGEVYGWIVRMVRDPAAAEDLTIETFWRIHRSRQRFDATLPFGAWARRIATNAAIDHLKSTRRHEAPLVIDAPAPQGPDAAVQSEARQQIGIAFRSLPVRLRAAATLALIEEQPYEEIAAALGTSESAVKSRVFRAVRILRRRLERLGIRP